MTRNRKVLAALLVAAVVALPLMIRAMRGDAGKDVDIAVVATQQIRPTILADTRREGRIAGTGPG